MTGEGESVMAQDVGGIALGGVEGGEPGGEGGENGCAGSWATLCGRA